jgi:hypothetical protein
MISLVDEPDYPKQNDIIGQVALRLAIHDVTEQPKAMTIHELEALEELINLVCQNQKSPRKELAEKMRILVPHIREFVAMERGAHNQTLAHGSYPHHYGKAYWKDYVKEARIAHDYITKNALDANEILQELKEIITNKGTL